MGLVSEKVGRNLTVEGNLVPGFGFYLGQGLMFKAEGPLREGWPGNGLAE